MLKMLEKIKDIQIEGEIELIKIFEEHGGLLYSERPYHFLLTSGLHSPWYFDSSKVLKSPTTAEKLAKKLVQKFKKLVPDKPNYIISPAMGGIIIGYEVAKNLGGVEFVYTEKDHQGEQVLKRFTIPLNAKVLLVEDIITTLKTIKSMIAHLPCKNQLIRDPIEKKIVVLSLIYRPPSEVSKVEVNNYKIIPLAKIKTPTWRAEECPLCREGGSLPIKGKTF